MSRPFEKCSLSNVSWIKEVKRTCLRHHIREASKEHPTYVSELLQLTPISVHLNRIQSNNEYGGCNYMQPTRPHHLQKKVTKYSTTWLHPKSLSKYILNRICDKGELLTHYNQWELCPGSGHTMAKWPVAMNHELHLLS